MGRTVLIFGFLILLIFSLGCTGGNGPTSTTTTVPTTTTTTTTTVPPTTTTLSDKEFIDLVERDTFLFFLEETDERGLTIESTAWPIGSIASSGFYLTSIPIAVERRWISYEDGKSRVLTTLNSYYDDPADPDDFYVENEHGFFPHWFYQETGKWNEVDVFSSIDTAILMAGILTVRQYFADDQEIWNISTKLYEAVDWEWMTNGGCTLSMGWKPDTGFIEPRWEGYNEGMLAVLLAMGSPTYPISEERCDAWEAWGRTYKRVEYRHGNQTYEFIESTSTSLFTYQYPLIWFDLKGEKDRLKIGDTDGIDYFKNSKNATLENRAYSIENPGNHKGYGEYVWGLTASECLLHESGYGAHGPRQNDDGTVAPTGVGGSMLFAPDESILALRHMKEKYGDKLWGKYGFKDAFNLDRGWFSPTYIGIDQGAILTMIENHRTGLIHSLFMQNEYAKKAMQKAGFTNVDTTPPAITQIQYEKENNKVVARVTDNDSVKSVFLQMSFIVSPDEGPGRMRRTFVRPIAYPEVREKMSQEGQIYSADIPDLRGKYKAAYQQLMWFYLEAVDINGNVASSRKFKPTEFDYEKKAPLSPDPPIGPLIVDRFDDCISKTGAGAWHGGSSSTEDAVIMFDRSVNHGETGCSMKVRYNVGKRWSYNGAWIKLDNLDLSGYKELVFWVRGDEEEGYTTTFKIELKSPEGQTEYIVNDVSGSWKRVAIPLEMFRTPSWASKIDLTSITEFIIVFEDHRATDKEGAIYVDDIYFTHKK